MTSVLFGMKADWAKALAESARAVGIRSEMADLRVADLSAYDAVVPLTLWDRGFLARRREDGETFNALFPDAAAQENCDDKLRFNRLMVAAGFGHVVPRLFADPAEVPAEEPVIIKRRRDEWGKLSRVAVACPGRPLCCDPAEEFVQEYVPGNIELSAHILMLEGRIAFVRTARFDMPDIPHVKGIQTGYRGLEWQDGSDHGDLFERILNVAGFHDGTCCIDFREVDGTPRIFEINPRLGGSLTGNAGDYLSSYVAMAGGRQPLRAAAPCALQAAA